MDKTLLENPYLCEYFALVFAMLLLLAVTFFSKKLAVLRPLLGMLLIATPIVYFYLMLTAHLVNIPFTDDYNLLETIDKFQREEGFVRSAEILFEQVNQHRFGFERLVMLTMVYFTGTVNLVSLIFFGNLFMLGSLFLFFMAFRKEQISWYYFIPVPYILFNLVYYENAYWGIAAIQNTPIIFFALLSIYGVSRGDQRGLIWGLIAAVVTTFVSGNGMLTWIIGLVIMTLQKRYHLLALWIGVAICVFAFYFLFDYNFIKSDGDKAWEHPLFNAISLFGFWGNALFMDMPHGMRLAFYPDLTACVLLGMFIGLVFLIWAVRILIERQLKWTDWFLLGAFMFVMGTGAMFVLSRPLNYYLMYGGNVFSRRYMIFGVAMLAITYTSLVFLTKRSSLFSRVVVLGGVLAFVALNFASYFSSLRQLRKQHDELSLDVYFFKNYSTFLTTGIHFGDIPFWNHPTRMKNLVASVESNGLSGLYASDKYPLPKNLIAETGSIKTDYKSKLQVETDYRLNENNESSKYLRLSIKKDKNFEPEFFVLADSSHVLLLPALPAVNTWSDFLRTRSYYANSVHYDLFRSKLPAGRFDVWMMSEDGSGNGKWESRRTCTKMFLF